MKEQFMSDLEDEKILRSLIENWRKAFERKDVAALMADYLPDALLFDCKPPYKNEGAASIREVWEACLPFFPEKFNVEHKDIKLVVEGNMAFLHCINHITVPAEPSHPASQTWLRVTVIYRKVKGAWKVAHEHVSIPFNPMTNQAAFIKDHNDLMCGVDYSQAIPA
jgi:uncharacterized protein (TIGR02246 family)